MDQLEPWGQLELASVPLCCLPTSHGHNQELQKKLSPGTYVLSWPRASVAPEKPALLMFGAGVGRRHRSAVMRGSSLCAALR